MSEPSSISIIRSTIELAHNFKLTVTAEGVENETALQTLRDLGCDQAQGYFISRPLSRNRFREWLRESAKEKSSASFRMSVAAQRKIICAALTATLLALFAGIIGLIRFCSRKDGAFLFIGTGFIVTTLNAYRAVITSPRVGRRFRPHPLFSSWPGAGFAFVFVGVAVVELALRAARTELVGFGPDQ